MLRLRPHHLICLRLFNGMGYDEAFIERMSAINRQAVDCPDTRWTLAGGADDICTACPNMTALQTCALGEDDVRRRDGRALAALGLSAGGVYTFAEAAAAIIGMTREAFEGVCWGCRWHEAGVCSFGELRKRVPEGGGNRTDNDK